MDGLNLIHFLINLKNKELLFKKINNKNNVENNLNFNNNLNSDSSNIKQPLNNNLKPNKILNQPIINMNKIQNTDRAIFIRNLLGLPQNLGEILKNAQNNNLITHNTLILNNNNNQNFLNNNTLSQIFNNENNINININNINKNINNIDDITKNLLLLQNLSQTNTKTAPQEEYVLQFFGAMISLSTISNMILQNSKEAVSKLIIAMATASKTGLNNEQIRETLSVLNSCIAMASSEDETQTIKSLLLLYLPWLPLNENIGFDIEVTSQKDEENANISKLIVLIQTLNFGNVKGEFVLSTSNSLNIFITCSEEFPKKNLLEKMKKNNSTFSVSTNIEIETVENKKQELSQKQETKVNLSSTNEMNPYLLLVAHIFIRETIEIDQNSII